MKPFSPYALYRQRTHLFILKKLLLIKILMVRYVKKQSQNKKNEGDKDVQEQVLPVTLIYIIICPILFTQMPSSTGKGYVIGRYFS